MLNPLPFALHANLGCPAPAELALSLAAEFHEVDAAEVDQDLAELAELVERCPADPLAELDALGRLLAHPHGLGRARGGAPADCLHVAATLRRRVGDPAALAVCLVEVARRRALDVGVVGGGGRLHLAHRASPTPVVLDLEDGRLRDARRDPAPLEWCCAHQICSELLLRLQHRHERGGDLAAAIRAAELRTALPFDDDSLERAERDLRRLRSRLN